MAQTTGQDIDPATIDPATIVNIRIVVEQSDDTGIWIGESEDVPGYIDGADTIEELMARSKELVPEMLSVNGVRYPEHMKYFLIHFSEIRPLPNQETDSLPPMPIGAIEYSDQDNHVL